MTKLIKKLKLKYIQNSHSKQFLKKYRVILIHPFLWGKIHT